MSLKEKIKNALKWKKTSEYCAEKLGITEEEFEKSTSETGTAFKLFKHRNKLQENSENAVQNDQS